VERKLQLLLKYKAQLWQKILSDQNLMHPYREATK